MPVGTELRKRCGSRSLVSCEYASQQHTVRRRRCVRPLWYELGRKKKRGNASFWNFVFRPLQNAPEKAPPGAVRRRPDLPRRRRGLASSDAVPCNYPILVPSTRIHPGVLPHSVLRTVIQTPVIPVSQSEARHVIREVG